MFRRFIPVVYLIVGVIVAQQNQYFSNLDTITEFLSAVLAIFLWPLLLLDVNLNIK